MHRSLELRSSGLTYRKLVYVSSNCWQKEPNGTDTPAAGLRENRETIARTSAPCPRRFYRRESICQRAGSLSLVFLRFDEQRRGLQHAETVSEEDGETDSRWNVGHYVS